MPQWRPPLLQWGTTRPGSSFFRRALGCPPHLAVSPTVDPMSAVITLVLYALASARITQLIIKDELLRTPRRWWIDHAPKGSLRIYWISCYWCVSIAAALAPAVAYVLAPHHPACMIAAATLAFSWISVGLVHAEQLQRAKIAMYSPQQPEQEATADGTANTA